MLPQGGGIPRLFNGLVMIEQLRSTIARMERPPGFEDPGRRPFGLASLDTALGGGLPRGALHEVSAVSEAHVTIAAGFISGIARSERAQKNNIVWIADDMAMAESGALY